MGAYLITYKKKRGRDTCLVEMPTLSKLLQWIEKNGASCSTVLIQLVEEVAQ